MDETPELPPDSGWKRIDEYWCYQRGMNHAQLHIGNPEHRALFGARMRTRWLEEYDRLKAMPVGLFANAEALEIHEGFCRTALCRAEEWRAWVKKQETL